MPLILAPEQALVCRDVIRRGSGGVEWASVEILRGPRLLSSVIYLRGDCALEGQPDRIALCMSGFSTLQTVCRLPARPDLRL